MKPKPPDTPRPDTPDKLNLDMEEPTKPAVKSKEIWGVVTTILGAILAYFGIEANPDFLADGFQAGKDIIPAIGMGIAIAGAVLKTYGKRAAVQTVKGIFR